jgi:hypothetical protein
MCNEENDSYFIHSDVFPYNDKTSNDGQLMKDAIDFLVISNRAARIDDDGDVDVDRPERIHLTLGISFISSFYSLTSNKDKKIANMKTNGERFLLSMSSSVLSEMAKMI